MLPTECLPDWIAVPTKTILGKSFRNIAIVHKVVIVVIIAATAATTVDPIEIFVQRITIVARIVLIQLYWGGVSRRFFY